MTPVGTLSFLAFYGVMVVGPLLQARLPTRFENSVIVGVFLKALSAEIMTLPFVLADVWTDVAGKSASQRAGGSVGAAGPCS